MDNQIEYLIVRIFFIFISEMPLSIIIDIDAIDLGDSTVIDVETKIYTRTRVGLANCFTESNYRVVDLSDPDTLYNLYRVNEVKFSIFLFNN